MTTVLTPMPESAFAPFLAAAVADYAADKVAAGSWSAAEALQCSRDEFSGLLPLGLATPDHHLLQIKAGAEGPVVGVLWFHVDRRHGAPTAYVYNVEIDLEWRRQGHASRAFSALEALAHEMGLARIGLHVFGHNPGAQALYARLGFEVTGINMSKRLAN